MGGWLGHRRGVAPLSLPVPACSQGMSLLIHALGPNCYLHSGTQCAELGEEGGGTGPTGAWAGPGGCTALRLQGKGWKQLPGWGGGEMQLSTHSGKGITQQEHRAQTSALSRLRMLNWQQRHRGFLLCLSLLALATGDRGNRSVWAAPPAASAAE